MSMIKTPSMLQQRIVLVAFAAIMGIVILWQNAGDSGAYSVRKFSKSVVPADVATLDFEAAEAAWSGLHLDAYGNLRIDALTETALVDALSFMDDPASMKRMAFLLEKQFGQTAALQIMELLPTLKNYKDLEQRWLTKNAASNPPPYAELFNLQDELFGATVAEKLFSTQRHLANLMLRTHEIQDDANLTQAQKDLALHEVQKSVQAERASIE